MGRLCEQYTNYRVFRSVYRVESGKRTGINLSPFSVLPEKIVFDGRLLDFIRLFPERTPEESCELVNGYLEEGVAEWVEGNWEFFTCRAAVLGCCSGFYLSVLNKKDLK